MRIRPSALIIKENKILTLKYTYPKGELLTLPGGNLEFGETLKSALERELLEEIGIKAQVGELSTIAEVVWEGENTIHMVFQVLSFEGEPKINPKETKAEEIVWLNLDDIPNINLYPNINLENPSVFQGILNQPRL